MALSGDIARGAHRLSPQRFKAFFIRLNGHFRHSLCCAIFRRIVDK